MPPPDHARLLAALPAEDTRVVRGWLTVLGMEVDELEAVPPLRSLVEVLAVLSETSALDPDLPRHERWNEAARSLGLSNGPSLLRRWYRWQSAAAALGGNDVSSDGPEGGGRLREMQTSTGESRWP